MKEPDPKVPAGCRLLNKGELTQAGDLAWLTRGRRDEIGEWRAVFSSYLCNQRIQKPGRMARKLES